MAITAALTISQGTDNTKLTLTDATTYDGGEPIGSMTQRQVVLYKSDGTVLDTVTFSGVSTTAYVEDLDRDYAVRAIFTITPPTPVGGSTYTDTVYFAATGYSMTNFYQRHNRMALNPRLENNRDYITDNFKILMEVEAANASNAAEDIVNAQLCLSRIKKIVDTNRLPY